MASTTIAFTMYPVTARPRADLPAFRARLRERGVESRDAFETNVCWISVVRHPDGNHVWLHHAKPAEQRT